MFFWTREDDLHALALVVSFLASVVFSVVYWGWPAVFVFVGTLVGMIVLFFVLSVIAQTVNDWILRRKDNRYLRDLRERMEAGK